MERSRLPMKTFQLWRSMVWGGQCGVQYGWNYDSPPPVMSLSIIRIRLCLPDTHENHSFSHTAILCGYGRSHQPFKARLIVCVLCSCSVTAYGIYSSSYLSFMSLRQDQRRQKTQTNSQISSSLSLADSVQ